MNRHLSPEEISLWMAGERNAEQQRHLMHCAQCAGELSNLNAALADFRSSARAWSEREAGLRPGIAARRPSAGFPAPLGFLLAAAALIALLAVPVYRDSRAREQAKNAAVDAMLLKQVDAGISRAVPETMEPLVELVSWGTGPTGGTYKGKKE